jgi:hypothetical protein
MLLSIISAVGSILGNGKVLEKGMELIDDAYTSDEEARESKTKAKIDLMKAYAPFKVAQRYLALMFSFTFLFTFFLTLALVLLGKAQNIDEVKSLLSEFYIGEIMLAIVIFYFGGGLTESVGRSLKKKGTPE